MPCNIPSSANATAVYISPQTDCETLPDSPVFTRVRLTSGVPTLTREVLQSAELTGSSEFSDVRLSNVQTNAEIGFELSYGSFDEMLAGAMQSDWVANAELTDKTVTVTAADKTFTVEGEDVTTTVKVGDDIYFKDLANDENKGPFLVTAVSFAVDTVITVSVNDDILVDEASATTNVKASDRLEVGTTRKYFSLLAVYNDFPGGPYYELTTGAEMTGFSMNGAVNALVTGTIPSIGRKLAGSFTLPAGATLEDANKNKPYSGIDTCMYKNGLKFAVATSVDIGLDRGAAASFVLCDKFVNHVGYDKANVTMNTQTFFIDTSVDDDFLAENVVGISARFGVDGKIFSATIPQGRITSAEKTVDTGDITQAHNVQAYKGDESSLILRRLDTTV